MSTDREPRKLQTLTRIPPYRPGDWVKLRQLDRGAEASDLSGKVLKVRSLTCSIISPDQQVAVWRVHLGDCRSVEWHSIERAATAEEIRIAERRHFA